MNTYERAYDNKLAAFGLDDASKVILWENMPLSDNDSVVEAEVVGFRLLGGTMIWLDIISAITTGKSPYLLRYHIPAIIPSSQTKLEDIMGCTNWPMVQIGRIAALHEYKNIALQEASFDDVEFERLVRKIAKEIQDMIECEPAAVANAKDPPTLISRMYVYMSSIYLHLVNHGFKRLEELDSIMLGAMEFLKAEVPAQRFPALVAPLYVMASIAKETDKPLFRHIFSSPTLLNPLFQHRRKILPILEEIWQKRLTTDLAWTDILKITQNILLI